MSFSEAAVMLGAVNYYNKFNYENKFYSFYNLNSEKRASISTTFKVSQMNSLKIQQIVRPCNFPLASHLLPVNKGRRTCRLFVRNGLVNIFHKLMPSGYQAKFVGHLAQTVCTFLKKI